MKKWNIVFLATLAIILVGCSSARFAKDKDQVDKLQNEKIMSIAQFPKDITDVTAKTSITVDYNQHPVTLKGRLRMRKDEVIQMSVTALGVVEVAFVELTPESVCIIDRINKKYAKMEFSSGMLNSFGVNFETIQSLFWNRIFILGKKNAWERLDEFKVQDDGSRKCIEPMRQSLLKCHFYSDEKFEQLNQTLIRFNDYEMIWRYDMFGHLGSASFPTVFDISAFAGSNAVSAHLVLSNVSYLDKDWEAGTNLSRYTQVRIEELLSVINLLR